MDVNDIALKLEEDRMELEQRLRVEVRHGIGLDGTPNVMPCYAMPCLQTAIDVDTASLSAQAQRSGNSGSGFLDLASTRHASLQTIVLVAMDNERGPGGWHDSPREAFCV